MNRHAALSVYLLTLGVFFTATSELVVSGILPQIAEDLTVSVASAGQLVTAFSLAFAIGTPIVTALTSRLDRRLVLTGSLLLFIAGCLASSFAPGYSFLLACRVILGVSAGVYLVTSFGTAARLVPPERLGRAIGTIIFGFSCSMILGVPIGITLTGWAGWRSIFLVLALAALGVAAAMLRLFPSSAGETPVPFRQQLKVLGSLVIGTGLLFSLFRESGGSILLTYLTSYLQDIYRMNPSGISLFMLVLGLFGAAGSRLGGYGVDRWGPMRIIVLGVALNAAALALLPLFSGSRGAGLALIVLLMLLMFMTGPAVQAYFIQQAPDSNGLVLSLNTSIIHLGLATGAGTGGWMINTASTVRFNPWLACLFVTAGLGAALWSFTLARKRTFSGSAI
ncbi:MFS transporter [Paenibacillus sp. CC-CFT747]|nr:MFS transporter [Paenibacillus sp. CC-CFT747]